MTNSCPPVARVLCILLVAASLLGVPASSGAADGFTWRLLNTIIYQGTGWGSGVLNMEGGEVNAPTPPGLITLDPTQQTRTWVGSPLSPRAAVNFGTAPWTLEFGGSSVITTVSWIPGAYDPASQTFTAAPGTAVSVTGVEPSTFTPATDFVLPPGANPALRVRAVGSPGAPSIVDTYDEQGERSPSSLRVAGATIDTELDRVDARAQRARCDVVSPSDPLPCPEEWVRRDGGADSAIGIGVAVAPNGGRLFVTGSHTSPALDTDIVTQALDPATGAVQWSARYAYPGSVHDHSNKILVAPDGATVYVTGAVCVVPTTVNCTSNYDIVAIAYDAATGARRWVTTFGGAGQQQPRAAALSPDGSTLVVGGYTSPIAGPSDPQDAHVAALSTTTGTVEWQRVWAGGAALQDGVAALAFGSEGSEVYAAGWTTKGPGDADALLLGLATGTGTVSFERVLDFGANRDDRAFGLTESGGVLYAAGTGVRQGATAADAVAMAFSAEGNEMWRSWHEGLWNGSDQASFIAVRNDAVYVGGSESRSSVIIDAFAAAYDASTGAPRWSARFDRPGPSYDAARAMSVTADGRRLALAVETGWFGNATRDYGTLVFDTATGEERMRAFYDGTFGGTEIPVSLAIAPDGRHAYVTGASQGAVPSLFIVQQQQATVAYRMPD